MPIKAEENHLQTKFIEQWQNLEHTPQLRSQIENSDNSQDEEIGQEESYPSWVKELWMTPKKDSSTRLTF